jgi:hypothetical protein
MNKKERTMTNLKLIETLEHYTKGRECPTCEEAIRTMKTADANDDQYYLLAVRGHEVHVSDYADHVKNAVAKNIKERVNGQ